jgi:HAD superfamily hydrolase (TIGR01509 family)
MSPPLAAVLFDLDGILVDTQDAEIVALREFGESIGSGIPLEGFADLVAGRRLQDAIDLVASYSGRAVAPPNAIAWVRARAEVLLDDIRPIPGVRDAIAQLRLPMFVVSNSPNEMIHDRLARVGLGSEFPGPHFSAYDVEKWKPDPGLYLAALDSLAMTPNSVVAIEDSDVGVRAAVAAGISVYWYKTRLDAKKADRANGDITVFGEMAKLPGLIERRQRRQAHSVGAIG